MYVPFLPCPRCAIEAIQVGITEIVYATEYKSKAENFDADASIKLLDKAGVNLRHYEPSVSVAIIPTIPKWEHGDAIEEKIVEMLKPLKDKSKITYDADIAAESGTHS